MSDSITLSETFAVEPELLYKAWLSSKENSDFTGGAAKASSRIGGAFTAWDGYIEGKNLELVKNKKIVQSWRSTEFPKNAKDSLLEIILKPVKLGTKLTLKHYNIPKGQGKSYKNGWEKHYFVPMQEYFGKG